MQSEASDSGCRAGRFPEEINENGFFWHRVLVGENANGSGAFQNLQSDARGFVLEDRLIPAQAPIAIDQRIDFAVLDRSRHVMQGKSVKRMSKGGKFPRANVPGQIQHAFSAPLALEKVFVAIEDDHRFDILLRVLRETRKLRGHPAEIPQHPTDNLLALRVAPIRKSDPQIELRGFPQLRKKRKKNARNRNRKASRHGPGQCTQPS